MQVNGYDGLPNIITLKVVPEVRHKLSRSLAFRPVTCRQHLSKYTDSTPALCSAGGAMLVLAALQLVLQSES